jgi:sec-independent protein translocase protein TatC
LVLFGGNKLPTRSRSVGNKEHENHGQQIFILSKELVRVNQRFMRLFRLLESRLAIAVLLVAAILISGYVLHGLTLSWIAGALQGSLFITQPTDTPLFVTQASLFLAALLAIPFMVYIIIASVRPILPWPVTTGQIAKLIGVSFGLTLVGCAVGYYITLPATLALLAGANIQQLHTLVVTSSYISYVMGYLLISALVIQLPLLMLLIDHGAPLDLAKLSHRRKWVIIGTVGTVLILPLAPDPLSQLLLGLPIVVVYEATFWAVWLLHRGVGWKLPTLRLVKTTAPGRKNPASPPALRQQPSAPRKLPKPPVIDLRNH